MPISVLYQENSLVTGCIDAYNSHKHLSLAFSSKELGKRLLIGNFMNMPIYSCLCYKFPIFQWNISNFMETCYLLLSLCKSTGIWWHIMASYAKSIAICYLLLSFATISHNLCKFSYLCLQMPILRHLFPGNYFSEHFSTQKCSFNQEKHCFYHAYSACLYQNLAILGSYIQPS